MASATIAPRCQALLRITSRQKEGKMSIAKIIEITAESQKSFDDAVKDGLARASKTIQNIQGAWVKDQEVLIKDNNITAYRVNLKVTFILD
jgi:hypothetical protein